MSYNNKNNQKAISEESSEEEEYDEGKENELIKGLISKKNFSDLSEGDLLKIYFFQKIINISLIL